MFRSRDTQLLIAELRRENAALKERNLKLRSEEWVAKYFDAADELERLGAEVGSYIDLYAAEIVGKAVRGE